MTDHTSHTMHRATWKSVPRMPGARGGLLQASVIRQAVAATSPSYATNFADGFFFFFALTLSTSGVQDCGTMRRAGVFLGSILIGLRAPGGASGCDDVKHVRIFVFIFFCDFFLRGIVNPLSIPLAFRPVCAVAARAVARSTGQAGGLAVITGRQPSSLVGRRFYSDPYQVWMDRRRADLSH